jgi:hypothetical protein
MPPVQLAEPSRPLGNARSAALALYYVLAQEGVVLDRAAPLLMTRWPASDPHSAEGLPKIRRHAHRTDPPIITSPSTAATAPT